MNEKTCTVEELCNFLKRNDISFENFEVTVNKDKLLSMAMGNLGPPKQEKQDDGMVWRQSAAKLATALDVSKQTLARNNLSWVKSFNDGTGLCEVNLRNLKENKYREYLFSKKQSLIKGNNVLVQRGTVTEIFGFKSYNSVDNHFKGQEFRFNGVNLVFFPQERVEPAYHAYREKQLAKNYSFSL